jgi:hypothetical protein
LAKKKRRYGGATLSVINELFQPSAANAQIVIEAARAAGGVAFANRQRLQEKNRYFFAPKRRASRPGFLASLV